MQLLQLRLMSYASNVSRAVCIDRNTTRSVVTAVLALEMSARADAGNVRPLQLWEVLLDSMAVRGGLIDRSGGHVSLVAGSID